MFTAKRKPAQEEPKLGKILPLWGPLRGPQRGILDSFGFFLARLLGRRKTYTKKIVKK